MAETQSDEQLECALDLMRRLPPQLIERNFIALIDLVPRLREKMLTSVDQPLKIAHDKIVGKQYLLCEYNRDGDSYRSPWSNTYHPTLEDGALPNAKLRRLEVEANLAFELYRDMYFEGGVSSVYVWESNHGFAGAILLKKVSDKSKKINGCWDSIHVIQILEKPNGRSAHYKLTSTAMLWLETYNLVSGTINLGGSITRQVEEDSSFNEKRSHIVNIGKMIEELENQIRSTLKEIYFGKTIEIVNNLRSRRNLTDYSTRANIRNDLNAVLQRYNHSSSDSSTNV